MKRIYYVVCENGMIRDSMSNGDRKHKKWRPRDILSVPQLEGSHKDYELIYETDEQLSEDGDVTLSYDLQNSSYEDTFTEEDEDKAKALKNISSRIEGALVTQSSFDATKKYRIDYQKELNPEQCIAVSVLDKPLLVIAGAGSGKTRVIIYKVAYLIENGFDPSSIVLLSFTRKASSEMIERTHTLLQNDAVKRVRGGTFHSFANRTLRKYGAMVGIPSNFTIIDVKDTEDIIDLQRQNLEIKADMRDGYKFPSKSTIQKMVSRSRNTEQSLKRIVDEQYNSDVFLKDIEAIYASFQTYKEKKNVLDYDDLLEKLRDGLKNNEQFRAAIQRSIQYVLVDEYQDTNNAQREIIELIVGNRSCVTVVGDDSQSIYAFRGANYENILRFSESFPQGVCVKIEENYRSGKEVLDFTNEIIKNARIGLKKKLRPQNATGVLPVIKRFDDANREAEYIASTIQTLRQEEENRYSDFAVLTRTSWVSGFVQTALMRHSIPFIVVGGIKFSERRHIRDVLAFLRVVQNPVDDVSWHRILNVVPGVGRVRASEIISSIVTQNGSINFQEFAHTSFYAVLTQYEQLYQSVVGKDMPPKKIVEHVIPVYRTLLAGVEDDYETRMQDVVMLADIAGSYPSLSDFLSSFVLDPPSDRYRESATPLINPEQRKDSVVVSTIHSAKGLEWRTVFLPVVLDGVLPLEKSFGSLEALEEERRLFYVASSRVKKNLFITMPRHLPSWGRTYTEPSRFLSEIDKNTYSI